MSDYERGTVSLSNGDHLSYIKQGSGPVVVLIPGWSQSAAQWKHQIDDLAQDHPRTRGAATASPGSLRTSTRPCSSPISTTSR